MCQVCTVSQLSIALLHRCFYFSRIEKVSINKPCEMQTDAHITSLGVITHTDKSILWCQTAQTRHT